MMRDWHADVMYPDTSTAAGTRTLLAARHRHIALTFTSPARSESRLFEASWAGGQAEADSEEELFRTLLEELQDCGSETHDWAAVNDKPDPGNPDNILRTQRLECAHCGPRQRVITVPARPPAGETGKDALPPRAARAGRTREQPR
jgi:hypothetical protein